jgi:hypothetical protein
MERESAVKNRGPDTVLLACVLLLIVSGTSTAQGRKDGVGTTPAPPAGAALPPTDWTRHHVVIIQGLPGDAAHAEHFHGIVHAWRRWFRARGVPLRNVTVLSVTSAPQDAAGPDAARQDETGRIVVGRDVDSEDRPRQRARQAGTATGAATRQAIQKTLSRLSAELGQDDSFWLLLLGHANHDGQHAYFHISGPDLRAVDYADLLEDLPCRQQVLWITTASSGWFLEPLSRPGRVVMTATRADAEPNETEFPAALVEAMQTGTARIDRNGDGQATLLELFGRAVERVEARYRADDRAPTEHALLDDNGDGRGTPAGEILARGERTPVDAAEGTGRPADGEAAARIVIPEEVAAPQETNGTPADAPDDTRQSSSAGLGSHLAAGLPASGGPSRLMKMSRWRRPRRGKRATLAAPAQLPPLCLTLALHKDCGDVRRWE